MFRVGSRHVTSIDSEYAIIEIESGDLSHRSLVNAANDDRVLAADAEPESVATSIN